MARVKNWLRISAIIVGVIFGLATGAVQTGKALGTDVFVRIAGDRISIRANEVPLIHILEQLLPYGIKVSLAPSINPLVTVQFENLPIQEGLSRTLRNINYILLWSQADSHSDKPSRLAEIQIFEPGKQNIKRFLGNQNYDIGSNPADGSLYIKGELLIRVPLHEGASDVLRQILGQVGAVVLEKHEALGIYRISVSKDRDILALVNRINSEMGELAAEANYAYPVTPPFFMPHPAVSGRRAEVPPRVDGKIPIAILDSGLAKGSELEILVAAGMDAIEPENDLDDNIGHGTQMAYIASGAVAPLGGQAAINPIIPIRTLDENGITSGFAVMRSIDFAMEQGARVMSLSWGSETRSEFLELAVNYAAANNMIIVASAGNNPTGKPFYPAAYSAVIGVGALSPDGSLWKQSNFGTSAAVYAPGVALFPVGYKASQGVYAGTSVAAAYLANQIAAYLSTNPEADSSTVIQHFQPPNVKH